MSHLSEEQWADVKHCGRPKFRNKGSDEQRQLSYWAAELLRLRPFEAENERLRAEVAELRIENEGHQAVRAMTVSRLGGEVEGRPTQVMNFLQRIDELRDIEKWVDEQLERDDEDMTAQCVRLAHENERLRAEVAELKGLIAECLALRPSVLGDMEKARVFANVTRLMREACKDE